SDLAPAAPVTFGRYTLLEKLAVGGMAEVFRAKIHSSHGFEKILVVKRILPHLAADPSFVAMFIDEAKLTAQLTHPKIVQMLDFGIAHAERRDSKTQAGTLKGKYGYMSPEQVVGRPIDARSDLFAIGVVLAELLTGRRLFSAAADLDVLLKVRDVRLDRLDRYGTDIPAALDDIVRGALKKDPAERPQTASALRDQLADYLFAAGERLGAAELRAFAARLLGADPDTAAQLLRTARHTDKGAAPGDRNA